MARVNISIDDKILADIDKSAKKLGVTRSAFITVCCSLGMVAPFGLADFETKKRELVAIMKGDISIDDDPDEISE